MSHTTKINYQAFVMPLKVSQGSQTKMAWVTGKLAFGHACTSFLIFMILILNDSNYLKKRMD